MSPLSWTSLSSEQGLCVGMTLGLIPSPWRSGHKPFATLIDRVKCCRLIGALKFLGEVFVALESFLSAGGTSVL